MEQKVDENTGFRNLGAEQIAGRDRIYESCSFTNCDFSYGNLSNITFISCEMDTCNFSLTKIIGTGFQQVAFKDCKFTGVNFASSSNFSFSVGFYKCILDYTIFQKKKLKSTVFKDCSILESDFSEADLSNAIFDHCDLNRTIFSRTILKSTDFVTSTNFDIDPENNTMTKAKFSADTLAGLLTKYNLVIE